MDSTGAASVGRTPSNGEREITLAKEIGPPTYLFDTRRFEKVFHGTNCVYIGHNRSRTIGDATRKNAHPFWFPDILGSHNGTIAYASKNRLEQGTNFKTDSEAIFNNIQVHGIKDTISRIEKSSGSEGYALVWYDKKDHTINFLRDDKRPLIYCSLNKGKTIFWCSEYSLMMTAIYRNGLEPDGKAIDLMPDTHYSFKIPEGYTEAFKEPSRNRYENYKWSYSSGKKNDASTNAGAGYKFPNRSETAYDSDDVDESGMVWGGLFMGMVPASHVETVKTPAQRTADQIIKDAKAVAEIVNKGDVVDESLCSGVSEDSTFIIVNEEYLEKIREATAHIATNNDASSPSGAVVRHSMKPEDIVRRRALERAEKAGLLPDKADKKSFLMFNGRNIKVYWFPELRDKPKGEPWATFRFDDSRQEWARFNSTMPPGDVPRPNVYSAGSHLWKHEGPKGKKVPYYRGWKNEKLDRESFESLMAHGCVNCSCRPEWGNEVIFISSKHDFICEWCNRTPGLTQQWLDAGKIEGKKVA